MLEQDPPGKKKVVGIDESYQDEFVTRTKTSVTVTKVNTDNEKISQDYTLTGSTNDINRVTNENAIVVSNSMEAAGDNNMEITSAFRTPEERSSTMYDYRLAKGSGFKDQYKGNDAATKVLETFDNYGPSWNCSKSETVSAMTNTMKEVGPEKVTTHCNPKITVIDIGQNSVSNPLKFHNSLLSNPGVVSNKLMSPINSINEGAFHIVFKKP